MIDQQDAHERSDTPEIDEKMPLISKRDWALSGVAARHVSMARKARFRGLS
jgi:hypothetical protein